MLYFQNINPNTSYYLTDAAGKVASTGKVYQSLNISFLSPGVYYLMIKGEAAQKIIKK